MIKVEEKFNCENKMYYEKAMCQVFSNYILFLTREYRRRV